MSKTKHTTYMHRPLPRAVYMALLAREEAAPWQRAALALVRNRRLLSRAFVLRFLDAVSAAKAKRVLKRCRFDAVAVRRALASELKAA